MYWFCAQLWVGLELDLFWSVEAGIFGLGSNGPWPFHEFKMGAMYVTSALVSHLSITSHHV